MFGVRAWEKFYKRIETRMEYEALSNDERELVLFLVKKYKLRNSNQLARFILGEFKVMVERLVQMH